MDTTTEIKHIDHLGLVAAVCDEAGIVDLINEQVGKDGRKVSVGHAVKATRAPQTSDSHAQPEEAPHGVEKQREPHHLGDQKY